MCKYKCVIYKYKAHVAGSQYDKWINLLIISRGAGSRRLQNTHSRLPAKAPLIPAKPVHNRACKRVYGYIALFMV